MKVGVRYAVVIVVADVLAIFIVNPVKEVGEPVATTAIDNDVKLPAVKPAAVKSAARINHCCLAFPQ